MAMPPCSWATFRPAPLDPVHLKRLGLKAADRKCIVLAGVTLIHLLSAEAAGNWRPLRAGRIVHRSSCLRFWAKRHGRSRWQ